MKRPVSLSYQELQIVSFLMLGWSCGRITAEVFKGCCSRQTIWRMARKIKTKYPEIFQYEKIRKSGKRLFSTSGQNKNQISMLFI